MPWCGGHQAAVMVYYGPVAPRVRPDQLGFGGWGKCSPAYISTLRSTLPTMGDSGESSSSVLLGIRRCGAPSRRPGFRAMGDCTIRSQRQGCCGLLRYRCQPHEVCKRRAGREGQHHSGFSSRAAPAVFQWAIMSSLHAISAQNAAAAANPPCLSLDLTALSTAWYNTLPDMNYPSQLQGRPF